MKFRFPDDPERAGPEWLATVERDWPGHFLAQVKADGWRRPVYFDGDNVKFYPKRGDGREAKKQPPEELVDTFISMGWPDGIALDMEWMGPRVIKEMQGRHEFWIFDILYHDFKWLGDVPFEDRLKILREIWNGLIAHRSQVRLLTAHEGSFVELFEFQKKDPLSEGIVLRERTSGLIGSRSKPTKNPGMVKVKYREI